MSGVPLIPARWREVPVLRFAISLASDDGLLPVGVLLAGSGGGSLDAVLILLPPAVEVPPLWGIVCGGSIEPADKCDPRVYLRRLDKESVSSPSFEPPSAD